jgi:cytochrome c-type biogenesis protein CcmH/NrfG
VTAPPVDATEVRLERAAAAHPDARSSWLELGKYEEENARPFEAMWAYAEALRLEPDDGELRVRLATVLQRGQVVDQAEEQLLQALRARPADLEARCRLAELYLGRAAPRRARSVMEAEARPSRRTVTRGEGEGGANGATRRTGDGAGIRDRAAGPTAVWEDAEAVLVLGRTLQACGDTAGAFSAFQRARSLQGQSAEAWYRLGRLYLELGRVEEARDGMFHALAADRSRPEYPLYAALTYLQQPGSGDLDRAIQFFTDAIAIRPNYAPAHYQYGRALERAGKRQEAVAEYEQAVMADLNDAEPNEALGRCLTAVGNRLDGHRYLGRSYDLADRPVQAVREFQAMAALAPKSVQPALLEGQIYIRQQQGERAVAITEAALKRHPDDAQLLERLAVLKINRGDRVYARRLLSHWLQVDPQSSRALWLLGRTAFGDMDYAGGVAWEEKALKQRPNNPHYLAFLGAGYLKLATPGSPDRAAAALAQAVALLPDNAEYRELYAQSLQRLGRDGEARRHYLQALDADPFRISCFAPAAQLAWRLNRPGAAAFFAPVIRSVQQRLSEENVLWRRVWDHPEDAAAHWQLAQLLCRTADLTRARHQLEQSLELRPDLKEARHLLATVRRCQEVQ